jgi:hypothetical protein
MYTQDVKLGMRAVAGNSGRQDQDRILYITSLGVEIVRKGNNYDWKYA